MATPAGNAETAGNNGSGPPTFADGKPFHSRHEPFWGLTLNNTVILAALAKAEDGTVFQTGKGAPCPVCGMRSKVVGTPKWEGRLKIRYHRCANPDCLLCVLNKNFKSIQEG